MSTALKRTTPAPPAQTTPPPARTSRAVPAWRTWNTPQTLWAGLYLVWGLEAFLLFAAVIGAQVHRDAMKTIGRDTAPSIIAAQHIKSALADMDSSAANELLGDPGQMPEAVEAYDKRRREAATALIEAAKNITYGDAEQKPIEAIQVGLGTYEVRIQRARDLHEIHGPNLQKPHEPSGADYVAAYREAAKVMDANLLTEADNLDQANHDELEKAYSKVSNQSVGSVFLLLLAGAPLLWALVVIQRFLFRRMHRILNPALVLATLLTIAFVLYTFVTLGSERHRLTVAKEDAFTSIHALWRARAAAYSANADESRYLLDLANAPQYESDFFAKAASLARLPGNNYQDAVSAARRGDKLKGFTGYLADELNNITFEGEREAAANTLERFGAYLKIDEDIRRLQHNGQHAQALELCIGTREGESNWAFDQFDKALGDTLEINQQAFNAAVSRGFEALSYFELKAALIALLIAALCFYGLQQRIQEYR